MFSQTISGSNIDSVVMDVPLSFMRSGSYAWNTGYLNSRRSGGYYWSSRVGSAADSRNLFFNSTAVNPRRSSAKGNGFAVRCVARDEERDYSN